MKKHDYDKILFRLTTIWARLREGETLTAAELSEEFNVSARTIQRDFNERLVHLFPIEKKGQKWKIKDGYSIDKSLDFEDEIILDILNEFGSSMSRLISKRVDSLFNKISNQRTNPIYSRLEIEDIYDKIDMMQEIQRSIEDSCQIEFYHNKKQRIIEPVKITTFDGYWYLYGKDIEDEKLKTFYIKDITNLHITKNKFKVSAKASKIIADSINIWFDSSNKPFEVELFVDGSISKYFQRRPICKNQRITEKYDDGSILIRLYATSEKEIITEVKKWLPNILIVSPKHIAQKLEGEISDFRKKQLNILTDH